MNYGFLEKKTLGGRLESGIEQLKQTTPVVFISSPCHSCTVARARCPMRDAATERFFLISHNPNMSHPNNLKFWEKLLCTCIKNFPTGSWKEVKLFPIIFVGKGRKTQTTARINLLLNLYKQSTT